MTKLLAAVRLRGTLKPRKEFNDTLFMMNLRRANHCVILIDNTYTRGSLEKVKDFITYGEVSETTIEKLVVKRARKIGDKRLDEKEAAKFVAEIKKSSNLKFPGVKPYFRLSPPSGGLRSVKSHFPKGDLGYRGDNINKLLERMI